MNIAFFLIVALVFAAIPVLIFLFVVRTTNAERTLDASSHGQNVSRAASSGSVPHIFARLPTILVLVILALAGVSARIGLRALFSGYSDVSSIKATIWGSLVFVISSVALAIKFRATASAKMLQGGLYRMRRSKNRDMPKTL